MTSRRSFSRNTGSRAQRALFIIVVEGETERRYFENLRQLSANLTVKVSTGKSSNPRAVIQEMERQIQAAKRSGLQPGDQAWIVFDQDNWSPEAIEMAWGWANERRKDRGIGFSRPQFEWWLLLHFEEGKRATTQREILDRLNTHIPDYEKGNANQLPRSEEEYNQAIARARSKVSTPLRSFDETEDIQGGFTTVHFLVERILDAIEASS